MTATTRDKIINWIWYAALLLFAGFLIANVFSQEHTTPPGAATLAPTEVETLRIKNTQLDLQVTFMQVQQLQQAYQQLQVHQKEAEESLAKELTRVKAAHTEWGDPSLLDFDATTVTFHKRPATSKPAAPVKEVPSGVHN